jgi:O-antigen/teichoic acid export membrane protein
VPVANLHHQILSNWLTLVFRQGLISVATIVGVFALAHLLAPSEFAVYGYVAATMLIAAAVGDLGLGAGLIKHGATNERLRGSLGLQLAALLPLGLLGVVVSVVAHPYDLSRWLGPTIVAIFVLVAFQTLPTALLEQRLAFGLIARVEVVQRLLFVGAACGLAVISHSGWSVAIAGAAAGAAGWAGALIATRWHWLPSFRRTRSLFGGFSAEWWQGRLAGQLNYAIYPFLGGLLFTQQQVGLIVWAFALTAVPTMLSPLVGRAAFPSLARVDLQSQVLAFRRVFQAVQLVSLPLVAAIFATARPLTLSFFGEAWRDGIPLLRLESVTTLLAIAITPAIPLLYLTLRPRTVKRVLGLWTLAAWLLTPLVAIRASYLAISIVQIVIGIVVLTVFARMLFRATGYSLADDMRAGLLATAVAVAVGTPLAEFVNGRFETVLLAIAVCVVQVGVTLSVTRDREVFRALAAAVGIGTRRSTASVD